MTKGSEYISRVLEQVMSEEQARLPYRQGAFLAAALSIMGEVQSPQKESALVSLAALAIRDSSRELRPTRRAA
jgi:hypothetical protein